jgi:hypothetical protein
MEACLTTWNSKVMLAKEQLLMVECLSIAEVAKHDHRTYPLAQLVEVVTSGHPLVASNNQVR